MTELSPGVEFAGHRIEEQVGRGGMGVVYRATDLRLKRVVALKVVAPELAADSGFRDRFEREAAHAAAIDHPNVISVFHAGEEDGVLFVTMRYVEGTDLDAMIAERGRLESALAAEIVSQVAAGLGAAHDHDLVHRDVKPANVLVRELDGGVHAYVTDFGLAKARAANTRFTATGMFVGTVDYIAPEQLEGKAVDGRADIYALGGVLHHMLTGDVPYPRDNEMAKLYAHGGSPPPVPSETVADLPKAFDLVVAKAMANEPDERYQTAKDLGAAAVAAAELVEVEAPPPTAPAPEPAAPPEPATPVPPPSPPSPPKPLAGTPVADRSPPPRAGNQRARLTALIVGATAVVVAAAAVLFLVVLPGGNEDEAPGVSDIPPGAVALVEDAPDGTITEEEFDRSFEQVAASQDQNPPSPGDKSYDEFVESAVSDLILGRWIEGEAAEQGVTVSDSELQDRLDQIKEKNFESEAEYNQFLEESGFAPEDALQRIRLTLLSEKLQEEATSDAEPVTEEDVAAAYEEQIEQFTDPDTGKVTPLEEVSATIRQQLEAENQQLALDEFEQELEDQWRNLTVCSPDYVVPGRCSNGPAEPEEPPADS